MESKIKDAATLKEAWEHYKKEMIPACATQQQFQECRRAFFTGAMSCFSLVTASVKDGSSEEEDFQRMQEIFQELKKFVNSVSGN